MKRLFFYLFIALSPLHFCQAQNAELDKLVETKRYTELNKRIRDKSLPASDRNIYQAVVYNAFGKAMESNALIEKIFNSKVSLTDSMRHMLLEAQHSNYVKLFDYKRAYETKKYLMEQYASFTKPENVFDEQQAMNIWQAVQNVPPQQVIFSGSTTVPVTKDPVLGLQRIPVRKGDAEYSFIFDTGAGISTIMDSMAKVLGLVIYDKIPVVIKGGITGLGTNVKLGIAKKLQIGSVQVKNVLFLVFPDSALTIKTGPTSSIKIDAILGFPVIKELGAITFYSDKLEIGNKGTEKAYLPNMAIEYLKPIIYLNYNGEDLPFTFDSGADATVLTEVFYNKYKTVIDKDGKDAVEHYGGAGGTKQFKTKVLPSIQFKSLNGNVTMEDVSVSIDTIHTGDDVYYGSIGQDLIRQYKSMTINFDQSWILFNN